MFLWTTKKGIKIFGLKDKKFAEETRVLAANQGLYNGFLAAGLIYALILDSKDIALFILACILVAGIYGSLSTKKSTIVIIQSVPAFIAMVSIFI